MKNIYKIIIVTVIIVIAIVIVLQLTSNNSDSGNNYDFMSILPFIFSGLFIAIYKIYKQKSKGIAHRFLTDINSSLLETEEEKKGTINVKVKNSPETSANIGNITINNSQVVIEGNNNKVM